MKKKPAKGPELPPGRACFPKMSAIKEMHLDPISLRASPVFSSDRHGRNFKDFARWLVVYRLREMPDDIFKEETGERKTWENTFLVAAKTMHVDMETVRKSYKKVQRAFREGKGDQFSVADWSAIPNNKKPRVRKPSKVLP
jgi:hypothetical protein